MQTDTLLEFEQYMATVLGLAPSTVRNYKSTVRGYLAQNLPPAQYAASGGAAERTVNRRRAALNLYLDWSGLALCDGRTRTVVNDPVVPWSAEQVMELLSTVRSIAGAREACAAWLAYSSLRAGAIRDLRLQDIYRNGSRVTLLVRKSKTARNQDVPLPAQAVAELDWYLRIYRPNIVKNATQAYGRHRDKLLLADHGGAYRLDVLSEVLYQAAEQIGFLRFIHFARHETTGPVHALRHSCATHMLANGTDSLVLQRLLMHRNASSTSVYAKPTTERLAREMDTRHPGGSGTSAAAESRTGAS